MLLLILTLYALQDVFVMLDRGASPIKTVWNYFLVDVF